MTWRRSRSTSGRPHPRLAVPRGHRRVLHPVPDDVDGLRRRGPSAVDRLLPDRRTTFVVVSHARGGAGPTRPSSSSARSRSAQLPPRRRSCSTRCSAPWLVDREAEAAADKVAARAGALAKATLAGLGDPATTGRVLQRSGDGSSTTWIVAKREAGSARRAPDGRRPAVSVPHLPATSTTWPPSPISASCSGPDGLFMSLGRIFTQALACGVGRAYSGDAESDGSRTPRENNSGRKLGGGPAMGFFTRKRRASAARPALIWGMAVSLSRRAASPVTSIASTLVDRVMFRALPVVPDEVGDERGRDPVQPSDLLAAITVSRRTVGSMPLRRSDDPADALVPWPPSPSSPRQHTQLDRAEIGHLQRLVASWGMLADFCFADLLLFVPHERRAMGSSCWPGPADHQPDPLPRATSSGMLVNEAERPLVGRRPHGRDRRGRDRRSSSLDERVQVLGIPVRLRRPSDRRC